MDDFTPRNIAKYVVSGAIAIKTTKLTANAITDYTRFEKDDMIVDISSGLVGWGVSAKLKPVTDRVVDRSADWIAVRRAKKSTSETPESE